VGGFITTVSVIVLLMLTIAELRALSQIRQETDLVVDRSEDGAFRINLNVTVLGLSCEFLSVDLRNSLGVNREDVNDETLHKYATDSRGSWMGSATRKLDAGQVHTYDIPKGARDHYGNQRHAIELNSQTFEKALEDYEVLLVDFHSPRCIHCIRLAPIYEIAAGLVKEKGPGHGDTLDSHKRLGVALATVDCIQNLDLCTRRHIQAYPTIHIYRQTRVSKPLQDTKPQNYFNANSDYLYEVYHGSRDAEAIASFALKVLDEVLTKDPTLGKNAFVGPTGTDAEGTGDSQSTIHAAGCRVEGYLDVRRVPGSVIIRPHSQDNGHEFDTGLVNVDHRLDHLSFGHRLARDSDDGPYSRSEASDKPVVVLGEADVGGFRGPEKGFSHIHYIKVVSRTVMPLRKPSMQSYEYSITSDNFRPKDLVPHIEFSFDLSPLQIRVRETQRGWAEGITAMLALIGGVFSSSFIIESIVSSFALWVADPKRA